jgi:hypothetical protein
MKTKLSWAMIAIALAALAARAAEPTGKATDGAATVTANKPITDEKGLAALKERNPRVLFITAKDSAQSKGELARLWKVGGEFDKMRVAGWTIGEGPENMVQIVDREKVAALVEQLNKQDFPAVAAIENGEIVRAFKSGCTTPLDRWTFGFLAKGIDERPPGMVPEKAKVETTGSYPLRGNHWSVEGDWNPTKEVVITHLRGPNHVAYLQAAWHIDDWSLEELKSLHDDLHEKYGPASVDSPASSSSSSSGAGPDYMKFKGR